MVYGGADEEGPDPGPGWERLERAARAAASALEGWRRRAREAEAEQRERSRFGNRGGSGCL